ncbi:MAG: chemotaxis protein CheA [Jannaschia sp.]
MDEFKDTFFEECGELLEQLEAGLLALQAGTQDADTVDAVFRAVHSMKGGAGAFDLPRLVEFAHVFETALDGLRVGRLSVTADVLSVLFRSTDRLGDLVGRSKAGETNSGEIPADLLELVAGLSVIDEPSTAMDGDLPEGADGGRVEEADATDDLGPFRGSLAVPRQTGSGAWSVTFDPTPDLLESGNEPLFLFKALQVLGHLRVRAVEGGFPSLADLDPSLPYLSWTMLLAPTADDLTETEIEAVFEFAETLCTLGITRMADRPVDVSTEDVIDGWWLPPHRARPMEADPPKGISTTQAASDNATFSIGAASTLSSTIRVDLTRIDRLVNLVGELVISQSMLAQTILQDGAEPDDKAEAGLDEVQQLTRDIQDSVMAIRAQPVRSLFQRMARIVREAAQATGKGVVLRTDGEDTEIDKTVVERLADPLTHMIRNAVDHGLETRMERDAVGKPPEGTVRLTARQQSDRVVIEVSDDGRGLDRARILRRAIDRGLVAEGATPGPAEIDRLLFQPGFSTSDTVSSLSGRGVGLDVVQRAIRDLNGTVSVNSIPGEGCRISINLPLTLAILDGMIVQTARQRMVIPLSAVIETQILSAARVETVGAGRSVARLRDSFVPLVDLGEGMGFPNRATPHTSLEDDDRALVFLQPDDAGIFALQVDAIDAQGQVVIKGLGDNLGQIPCVSAATILGDGQVALIVDPAGLASLAGLAHVPQSFSPQEIHIQ